MKHVIQLCSGQFYDFENPDEVCLTIEEIAYGLARTARFGGHTRTIDSIYSVAQHSILASHYIVDAGFPELALDALLHDAAESVLGDVPSPLKALLPDFKAIEARVEQSIATQYDIQFPMHPEVKKVDIRLLATERRDFHCFVDNTEFWGFLPAPYSQRIELMGIEEAYNAFIGRYYYLTKRRFQERRQKPQ